MATRGSPCVPNCKIDACYRYFFLPWEPHPTRGGGLGGAPSPPTYSVAPYLLGGVLGGRSSCELLKEWIDEWNI